ncbi:hypothetical protein QJS10_CPA08g00332 [Acorus calamus]|uniref:Bifunctional inhibitor/plant lipid transfer protein/seed storage helical domain-containing protein n=1 Tax=Acorus calamus TaxID=4465 RepID=A0AAV9E9H1_ACOCL|nr:hypothetical protein QJS10_CPA08g00332 [Acorus calamus]
MALRGLCFDFAVVLVAATLIVGSSAQSGCTTAIIGLAPCLNFITGNTSTPASSCCSQLASVVQSNPRCLCTLLNGGGSSFGINVNQTLALALPGACNVQTPPVSQCNAATTPAQSPNAASKDSPTTPSNPTPTSPSTPSASGTPAGNGSKAVPGTSGQSSDGSSNVVSLSILFFLLSVASYGFPTIY